MSSPWGIPIAIGGRPGGDIFLIDSLPLLFNIFEIQKYAHTILFSQSIAKKYLCTQNGKGSLLFYCPVFCFTSITGTSPLEGM